MQSFSPGLATLSATCVIMFGGALGAGLLPGVLSSSLLCFKQLLEDAATERLMALIRGGDVLAFTQVTLYPRDPCTCTLSVHC